MIKIQDVFTGGIDLLSAETKIDGEHYKWLINGRNRFNFLEPIRKHVEITAKPQGIYQGCVGVGNVLIIFVSGAAYAQKDGEVGWQLIPGFSMSSTATQYWTQTVPASNMHFVRHAQADVHAAVQFKTDFKLDGSPACIVVQDGTSQPYIIVWDDVNQIWFARQTQNYIQWRNIINTTADKREYVPIGKQMMYLEGILFIVAPDGKSVYRSITGRPLDFMVNVDTNGNKMVKESEGGAATVSFTFDYDEITCLQPVNVASSFIYGTARNVRILTMDFVKTIFSEPTFFTSALFSLGIVNQYCVAEVLGDYTCIDTDGIKLFNAVYQLKFRGRNSNFSLMVSKLLHKIKQQNPICVGFDNYVLYNLDTIHGNIFLVYDALTNRWISMEITDLARVKQFAIVEVEEESKLYAITENNELFQLYGSTTEVEVSIFRTKAFTVDINDKGRKTSIEHKGQYFRPLFEGGTFDGEVTLIELVDEQESTRNRETKTLKATLGGVRYPVRCPVIPSTEQRVENPTFSLTEGLTGKKISYILVWTNDAQLVEYEVKTSEMASQVSQRQQEKSYSSTYGSNSND